MVNSQKRGLTILSKEIELTKMKFVNENFTFIEDFFSIIYAWQVHLISLLKFY